MPLTHYPNGVSSFGLPVLGAAPSIPVGSSSQYWFVDPKNGNDGNQGTLDQPFATITHAYSMLRSGYWDGIFLIGYGAGTASADLSATLTWSANYTFLIGLCAPTLGSQRARISNGASTNLMTPLVNFSATQVIVKNINFFNGGNDATAAAVCVLISGQRCYFENCSFSGGGTVASAGNAAMRSLVIDGTGGGTTNNLGENEFVHCTIGLDTELRSAASSELAFTAGFSPRNVFEDCLFLTNGSANNLFFSSPASGTISYTFFSNCMFYNNIGSGGAAMNDAYSINASNGDFIMQQCSFVHVTALPASSLVWGTPLADATTHILKAVNPT